MNKQMKVLDQVDKVKAELKTVKPRSQRRIELEARLRVLMTKLLRSEIRIVRRSAA